MSRSPSGGSHLTLEGGQFRYEIAHPLFFSYCIVVGSCPTGSVVRDRLIPNGPTSVLALQGPGGTRPLSVGSGAGPSLCRFGAPAPNTRARSEHARDWVPSVCRFGVMTRSGSGAPELQNNGHYRERAIPNYRAWAGHLRTRSGLDASSLCRFGAPAPNPFGIRRSRTTK